MIVNLTRAYVARDGTPVVDRVDTRIFRERYFAACMDCTFCYDSCCQYGATVEATMVEAISQRADELEPYVGVPRDQWFEDGFKPDVDYPGGLYTRTRVKDGSCVFLNRTGRGCLLHRFALERGIQVQSIKPMVCNMFPVLAENGVLVPPLEIDEESLVCQGAGLTIYRGARNDLSHYFGPDLVAELDMLEASLVAPLTTTVSLPVLPGPQLFDISSRDA